MLRHLERFIKEAAASKETVQATPFLLPRNVG